MNLITVPKLVVISGVSKQRLYKLLREGKQLQYHKGSNKVDLDDFLTKTYLNNPSSQRMSTALEKNIKPSDITYPGEENTDGEETGTVSTGTVEDYGKQRTIVQKQTGIKLKLANAQTRGQLMQDDLVEEYLFLYLDKLHSALDRMGGAALTDIGRKILTAGDIKPEHRLAWKDLVKGNIHIAKTEIMERLDEIKTLQAGGGK